MDPQPCGRTPPICLEEQVENPSSQLFPGQAGCPAGQNIRANVQQGFRCRSADQPGNCKCHEYSIRVKCPWVA